MLKTKSKVSMFMWSNCDYFPELFVMHNMNSVTADFQLMPFLMQAWVTSMQKQVNEFLEGSLFLLFIPLNRTPWCIGIRELTLSVRHISACRFWLKTLNGEADMLPSLEPLTSPVWHSVPRSHTVFWMHQLAQSVVPTPSTLHPILISHWESCKGIQLIFDTKMKVLIHSREVLFLQHVDYFCAFLIYFSGLCSNFGSLLSVTSIHLHVLIE